MSNNSDSDQSLPYTAFLECGAAVIVVKKITVAASFESKHELKSKVSFG